MTAYGISLYFGDKIYTYIYGADPEVDHIIIFSICMFVIAYYVAKWLERDICD